MNAGIEPGSGKLVDRAKAIILKPKEEWPKIEAETAGQGEILRSYVLPLAAIAPITTLIGGQIFGYGAFGFSYRPSLVGSIVTALVSYVLAIVSVYVLMFIADFLAPKFGGRSDRNSAFKLVAYGSTAAWLAGVFNLVPALSVFGLLGLYSIYLYYSGATPLMKVPQDKSVAYTAVTIVCAILLMIIVTPITAAITGLFGFGAMNIADRADGSGTITLPGGGEFDTSKVEEAAKRMEKVASGEIKPVATAELQELLPESIGPFERTGTRTLTMGQMGSGVEGEYKAGEQEFDLRINDMAGISGLAHLGAAMGVEQSEEDADGYERIGVVDGKWRTEKWDRRYGSGKYGIMIADRFQVEASGRVAGIEVLKGAVAEIDEDDLEDLVD
ncbi:MAG: YIP1 family protein [Novosphingobium sp.]|nr:YIP1 family protein [Novosphingobium sp.]MCP5403124.1 YIP1 family protein [Novosphingobium sp.]